MNELNWKQVLEIETYINKVIDDNVTMFEKMFWDQGKKEYLTLYKKKYYTLSGLKEYFYEKYPNNEYYKGAHEVIQELFTISLSGVRIIEIDDSLLYLNTLGTSTGISELDQRIKFLLRFNDRIGLDVYWYNVLKEVVLQCQSWNSDILIPKFLGVVDSILKIKSNVSIDDFDRNILKEKWDFIDYNKSNSDIKLFAKLDLMIGKIKSFKDSSEYRSFRSMCDANGYDFYYQDISLEAFLKDSIAYSIDLCLSRIKKEKQEFFSHDLCQITSLYPKNPDILDHQTLMFYITPFGFCNFHKISELFKTKGLEDAIKNYLSNYFDVIKNSAIIDREDYRTEWDKFDSSLIIGVDLKYKEYWGRQSKKYINKLLEGCIWFNDDVHGTSWGYMDLHLDSAYEGEQDYSMPAKTVLYYYSELRLENANWDRPINGIYEAGYRDSKEEDDNKQDEDYNYDYW